MPSHCDPRTAGIYPKTPLQAPQGLTDSRLVPGRWVWGSRVALARLRDSYADPLCVMLNHLAAYMGQLSRQPADEAARGHRQ